jgi:hypothetical protein
MQPSSFIFVEYDNIELWTIHLFTSRRERDIAVGVVVIALDWQLKVWWFNPTLSEKKCNEVNSLDIDKLFLTLGDNYDHV